MTDRTHRWRIADIISAVADAAGVSAHAIRSRLRLRRAVDPRYVAALIAIDDGYSLNQFGRAVGRRDHTTVLVGVRRTRARIAAGCPRGAQQAQWVAAALQRLEAGSIPTDGEHTPTQPEPPVEPELPPEPVPPTSRAGFVNRRGEIIVGPLLCEIFDDRWHRQRGWKRL